ncbi:sensor histidine kinase [Paenibacillus soyae]|uniref:histidine kinase n=1 Tax=Paenibacillus soyae TaxID=2969249 RepID=A0A9X2SAY7_9BACL|nr:HAMP domain-containing sensor histidine kinase [Paenibacillus soyae]MCR2805103.1 HAMP domain-containing histidine kinase [Paenibacillus soyae]
MSIKVKLYMSYLAMAIVPVILLCLFMLFLFFAGNEQDLREFTEAQKNESFNQAIVYGELLYVLREQQEKMDDPAYLSGLQEKLSMQWAGILLTRDGIVSEISPFLEGMSADEDWQHVVDEGKNELFLDLYRFKSQRIPFVYTDGSEGEAIIYYRSEPVPIFWHPLSIAASLLFVGLTSLLLTYFVSRSIIRPIRSLRAAALRIKDGDLSYEFQEELTRKAAKQNEISQLASAFEEMRIRLKQSIDQSLQYEENRKLLLSHISHDLKTPISAIKGYVEGIMDGIANTDEKRIRYMETIYRKASDMDQLIDELFLFSKLDLHKVAYDFKLVDMIKYMNHLAEEQRFDMEKAGVRLQFEVVADEPLLVAADPDKLYRVFTNMLDNSVKYMLDDGGNSDHLVLLRVGKENGFAKIEIEDTGPGIDPSDLPHIFEGFYRAEQSRNSETGGSGLGLAIVSQIVSGHGGEVWAENKADGGARFCIKLPLAAEEESEGGVMT